MALTASHEDQSPFQNVFFFFFFFFFFFLLGNDFKVDKKTLFIDKKADAFVARSAIRFTLFEIRLKTTVAKKTENKNKMKREDK